MGYNVSTQLLSLKLLGHLDYEDVSEWLLSCDIPPLCYYNFCGSPTHFAIRVGVLDLNDTATLQTDNFNVAIESGENYADLPVCEASLRYADDDDIRLPQNSHINSSHIAECHPDNSTLSYSAQKLNRSVRLLVSGTYEMPCGAQLNCSVTLELVDASHRQLASRCHLALTGPVCPKSPSATSSSTSSSFSSTTSVGTSYSSIVSRFSFFCKIPFLPYIFSLSQLLLCSLNSSNFETVSDKIGDLNLFYAEQTLI